MSTRTTPTSNGRRPWRQKALIAGVTGAIGGALARHLVGVDGWRVVGLCRNPAANPWPGVEYVYGDMGDGAACREALSGQGDITHLFYCGRADHDDRKRENVEGNLQLLRHVLEATLAASPDLQHVHLVQGGKYYGVHVGPFSTPAREEDPRSVVSNFYYAQEDFLRERAAASHWRWSASRPNTLLHFSPDNPRNLVSTLGAYAAISRELGCALDFPGPAGAFDSLTDMTSTDLLSRAIAWMATEEPAGDNAFNVANGDLVRWSRFWPKLAAAFDMPVGIVRPVRLADVMADKEEVWSNIVKRHSLVNQPLSRVATWAYGDGTLERTWDEIMSMTKARTFGFSGFTDSEADFFEILGRYREAKLLP